MSDDKVYVARQLNEKEPSYDRSSWHATGEIDDGGTFAATTHILHACDRQGKNETMRELYVVNAEGETQSTQQNFVVHGTNAAERSSRTSTRVSPRSRRSDRTRIV